MYSTHDSNPKQGGAILYALIFVLAIAAAAGAYLYFSKSQSDAYATETSDLATATSLAIHRLGQQASESDLDRIRAKVSAYQARSDADPTVLQSWTDSLDAIRQNLAQTEELVNSMQKRVSEFDIESSVSQIEAFEAELKAFDKKLNTSASNGLLREWASKRRAIMAEIQSISATIIAKSFPSGAKTYLDGEFIGLSSLGIQNVRKGKHLLAFEKDGYLRAEQEIEVLKSGTIEAEVVELKLAIRPLSIQVTGAKKRSKVSISIEKTADNNEDILLFIEDKEGTEATFENAPLGRLTVSVTVDNRLAFGKVVENNELLSNPLVIALD